MLEVRLISINLASDYAYNGCRGFIPELCGPANSRVSTLVHLDRQHMTAEVAPGVVVPLHPFFGSIGIAPAPALGRVSSNPPSRHAGNLDNKELVAGTTLYIPVFVKGALLEIGDGHAAQGDGEVEKKGLTETQAYQAASMAADLRITELVDGNVGVHMMIAKSYLK